MAIDLIRGDCLDLMKNVPDNSIDMILCDLPYGTTSRNKWDIVIPIDEMWVQYKRIIKHGGAIALFSQQPFSSDLIQANRKMFRYEWIWEKPNAVGFLNANRMPLRAHENILIFYDKLPVYNPQKKQGKPYVAKSGNRTSSNYGDFDGTWHTSNATGLRFPRDVISFNKEQGLHPTQKPVPLCEYLIRTYTNTGDIVLDNCMGSGSTGVACVNSNRSFIGMELNLEYFDVACQRISDALESQSFKS